MEGHNCLHFSGEPNPLSAGATGAGALCCRRLLTSASMELRAHRGGRVVLWFFTYIFWVIFDTQIVLSPLSNSMHRPIFDSLRRRVYPMSLPQTREARCRSHACVATVYNYVPVLQEVQAELAITVAERPMP
jgi:hypothetical protein